MEHRHPKNASSPSFSPSALASSSPAAAAASSTAPVSPNGSGPDAESSAAASRPGPSSTIRHAGRVHVRGMIRRVWRPRCLELHSDGVLRYYEAVEDDDRPRGFAAAAASGSGQFNNTARQQRRGEDANAAATRLLNPLDQLEGRLGSWMGSTDDGDDGDTVGTHDTAGTGDTFDTLGTDDTFGNANTAASGSGASADAGDGAGTPAGRTSASAKARGAPTAGGSSTMLLPPSKSKRGGGDGADGAASSAGLGLRRGDESWDHVPDAAAAATTGGSGIGGNDGAGGDKKIRNGADTADDLDDNRDNDCDDDDADDEDDGNDDDDGGSVCGGLTPKTCHYYPRHSTSGACATASTSTSSAATPKSKNTATGASTDARGTRTDDGLAAAKNGGGRQPLTLPELMHDFAATDTAAAPFTAPPPPRTTTAQGEQSSARPRPSPSMPGGARGTTPPQPQQMPNVPHHRIHHHRPKVTMLILHARTIDSSTFRDMHVGLPKGSYGFMFRGRPIVEQQAGNDANGIGSPTSIGIDAYGSSGGIGALGVADGNSSLMVDARVDSAYAASRADVYKASSGSGNSGMIRTPNKPDKMNLTSQCKPSLHHVDTTSQLHGHGQSSANATMLAAESSNDHHHLPPPRDYLCAVPTQEQADSWVVALQWAAGAARRASARMAARAEAAGLIWANSGDDDDEYDDDDNDEVLVGRVSSGGVGSMKSRKGSGGREKFLQSVNSRTAGRGANGSSDAVKPKSRKNADSSSRRRNGRRSASSASTAGTTRTILVTKVRNYHLAHELQTYFLRWLPVRVGLLYEVRTLLLRDSDDNGPRAGDNKVGDTPAGGRKQGSKKSGSRTACRPGDGASIGAVIVEERTVYRSHNDVAILVQRLRETLLLPSPSPPSRRGESAAVANLGSQSPIKSENDDLFLSGLLQKAEHELQACGSLAALQVATSASVATSSGPSLQQDRATTLLPRPSSLTEFCTSYRDVERSIARVDGAIRLLATNGRICNSSLLKEFLGLEQQQRRQQQECERQYQTRKGSRKEQQQRPPDRTKFGSGLCLATSVHRRTNLLINPGESSDAFVRRWLSAAAEGATGTADRAKLCVALVLQNTAAASVVSGVVLSLLYLIVVNWRRYVSETRVTIGIDSFLGFVLTAFYGGYILGNRRDGRSHQGGDVQLRAEAPPPPTVTQPSASRKVRKSAAVDERAAIVVVPEEQSLPRKKKGISAIFTTNAAATSADEDVYVEGSIDDDREEDLEEEKERELLSSAADGSMDASSPYAIPNPIPFDDKGPSAWSKPDDSIFRVRGPTYLSDRVKVPSAPAPFTCRGVDVWLSDNPERHIARHPSVLGGKLGDEDTFIVNFLLPFGNFVSYFTVPPLEEFPNNVGKVWNKFVMGDQQYRDARLKMLPIVVDGPWIVQKAVGSSTAPALLGKVIPLQYYFTRPTPEKRGVYEVDVIITGSRIAKAILNVVKGHTKSLTIAFAFIIEAADEDELPETVLCAFRLHELDLENCQQLPECHLDDGVTSSADEEEVE